MGSDWRETRLGDVVDIYDGPHATPAKTTSGPVFLGISNFSDGRLDLAQAEHLSEEDFARWTRRVTPATGDLVFSYETRLGEAALLPLGLRCCLGRRMGLMRVKAAHVESRFLLYAFLGPAFQATIRQRTIRGSTVDRIPLIDLPNFEIGIPTLQLQRAIARILGALDDKIDLNRRMNETLEAMARALFQSWFVDFDPVRAKAAGRPPASMTAEIAKLFPSAFWESKVGPIPVEWSLRELDEIAIVVVGQSPPGDTYNDLGEGMPLINGPAQYGDRSPKKTLWTTAERVKLCQSGDLIFCVRGSTTGRMVRADGIYALGRGVCAIRSKLSFGQPFVDLCIKVHLDDMLAKTTGSVFPNLSAGDILAHRFIVPDPACITVFGRLAESFLRQVHANESASKSLAALRDTLLPKLLSGELRVPDAEAIVGKAL